MSRRPFNPFKIDPWKRQEPRPMPKMQKQMCPQCNGRGQIWKSEAFEFGWKPCPACRGTGYIEYRKFWK